MASEETGISIISAKPLDPDGTKMAAPVAHVYHNEAFDSGSFDASGEITNGKGSSISLPNMKNAQDSSPTKTPYTNTTTANNNSNNNISENMSRTNSVKTSGGLTGLYDDIHYLKKGQTHHGSVEIARPEARRRESRLKSISDGPYRGMGKDELLRFSSRPLWRNLRYASISIVLMGWLALLITVVALVLTYPPCRTRESVETAWWQKSVIYRVYVRSFQDASGSDGIGDLKGIRNRLDYLQNAGVDTISLSPIYKLPSEHLSLTDTDIVDHKAIDPVFGTLDEFKLLLNETHSRGMYLILDFIPNHTSEEHEWFIKSSSNSDLRTNEFRSYYTWTKGSSPINNWKTVYGCPAWTEHNNTSTYYLHQFKNTQPDLNLRSDKVKDELEDILKFWLDLGVDGFYIRDSDFLFEDYDMRDEELIDNTTQKTQYCGLSGDHHPYSAYNHEYTRGLDQNLDIIARWRALLDDFSNATQRYRVLLTDVTGQIDHVMDYYGLFNRDGVDFPLNAFSHQLNASKGGVEAGGMVSDWMDRMPKGKWANWMSGDDRVPRMVDRLGARLAKVYLMMIMLLPGTPFIYYGDEIGMASSSHQLTGPEWSREKPMRAPMSWTNRTDRGFCDPHCAQPWMNYSEGNSDVETQLGNPESMLHLFKNLTNLRRDNPSFEYGDFIPALQDEEVYSFVREFDDEKGYLVALNFGETVVTRKFTGSHATIPGSATIELVTEPYSGHDSGSSISCEEFKMAPGEGIVVSWAYDAKEL